jgi:dihydrofolate reductase
MRKVTFGGANSADNFITGPDESIDWLRTSEDVRKLIEESWKGVDAMLMGRKTWQFAQRMGGGPGVGKIKTYVFSRTLDEDEFRARISPGDSAPELIREDAVEFVRKLKDQPGGDIIVMGGGELGSALIEGGVVDEIGLNIHPLLLGQGTPLFRPMNRRVELDLIEARAISQGCVLVRWRVVLAAN